MIPNPLDMITNAAEGAMNKFFGVIIDGLSWLIGQIFGLIDKMSVFDISTTTVPGPNGTAVKSPIADLWPWMMWLGMVLAAAMFFWALLSGLIRRDGRTFGTAVLGAIEFAVVTASYVAIVAVLVEMSEVISSAIMSKVAGTGVGADNQWSAVQFMDTNAAQTAEGGAATFIMAIVSFFSIIFALFLYLELSMRPVMVMVLVATSPIAAAGLLTQSTRKWMKLTFTWTLAAIFAKPLIAAVLVIAMTLLKWTPGLQGLLGATAMLCVAVLSPFGLVRMLSFAQDYVASNVYSKGSTRSLPSPSPSKSSGHSGGVSENSSPGLAAQQSATASRMASAVPSGQQLAKSAAHGLHSGHAAMNRMAQTFTEQLDTSGIGPHVGTGDAGGAGRHRSGGGHSSGHGHSASSAPRSPGGGSHSGSPRLPPQAQKALTVVEENPEIAAAAL